MSRGGRFRTPCTAFAVTLYGTIEHLPGSVDDGVVVDDLTRMLGEAVATMRYESLTRDVLDRYADARTPPDIPGPDEGPGPDDFPDEPGLSPGL